MVFSLFFLTPFQQVQAGFLSPGKKAELSENIETIAEAGEFDRERDLEDIISTGIRIVLSLVGSVFLILAFLAGFKWMRSAGNKETIADAQRKLKSLLIGLVLVLSAYIISSWVAGLIAKTLVR